MPEEQLVRAELDAARFPVRRAEVRPGVQLAFSVLGEGGRPLLLVHGWPETRRVFWRVIEPLAAAGFEVIAPDLRGFGDSGLAPDDAYDVAAHARDLHALVHDVLGHRSCCAAGGDLGSGIVADLGVRFPGFLDRQCVWNGILPILPGPYREAGVPEALPAATRTASDYYARQGREADELAAELDTPQRRRRYVEQFYGSRFWASPGAFGREEAAWHAEPFEDPEKLRAGFGNYESAMGRRPLSEKPCLFEPSPVPTLILHGPDDHVIWPDFPLRASVAFPEHVGPFTVPGSGHFLPWEQPHVFAQSLAYFLLDRSEHRRGPVSAPGAGGGTAG